MKAGKIVLLVFGVIILLISLVPLLAGGGLMWVETALRDSQGFYTTPAIQLEKGSHAIVTEPANIDLRGDRDWLWKTRIFGACWDPKDFLTLKLEGSSNDASKQVFLGIAPMSDLKTYLKDVEYDEVTDFKIRGGARLDYTNHPGTSAPEPPTDQTFWTASVHGQGTQSLEWGIEEGTYSFVLMNADGSRGLDLDASLGVKVPPVVGGIGIILLVVGLVLLGVAILMIYLAARRPKAARG